VATKNRWQSLHFCVIFKVRLYYPKEIEKTLSPSEETISEIDKMNT
jgi:hypothetical protein